MKLFNTVLALALVAGNAAYAAGPLHIDARALKPTDISNARTRSVEGEKYQEQVDFLNARKIRGEGGLTVVKAEVVEKATGELKELIDLNAKYDILKLGQNGQRADMTDLLVMQRLASNTEALRFLKKMVETGEDPGFTRVMARYLAMRRPGAVSKQAISPEAMLANNKEYKAKDEAEVYESGPQKGQKVGKHTRYNNHLALVSNMAIELYVNPSLTETRALSNSIRRLKMDRWISEGRRGESPLREDMAKIAEKLLENKCL